MKTNKLQFLYYLSFAVTIFLSAFLLFQIQPIIGKYILPWFGGASFVWITLLLFFQTLLLAGYFYAYLLAKLSLKKQLLLHSLLIVIAAALIIMLFSHWRSPITPGNDILLPETFSPALQVLGVLLIAVGLPYFLLSTTSTLLQKWFSSLPHNKSPYPLYALSNTGSLLAIVSYPFVIEPFLSLQNQGYLWSIAFIALCILLLISSIFVFVFAGKAAAKKSVPQAKLHNDVSRFARHDRKQLLFWLILPAVSSLMLLSGTQQLTQGIAPIPFLWLLPLGLYLISFILCFSELSFYKRNIYAYCFLLCIPIALARFLQPPVLNVLAEILLFGVMLFSCFMLCHGELFAKRPAPKDLNAFYLITALGSVIGAVIVALIAPFIFIGLFWEFLIGLFLTTLLAFIVLVQYNDSYLYRKLLRSGASPKEMRVLLTLVVCLFYIIIGLTSYFQQTVNTSAIWRNFYGTLRITSNQAYTRCLINGKIIHGCQPIAEKESMKPTTYFGEKSIGLAIDSLRTNTKKPLRIGTIGLGVGTIAAYGQKGDLVKFYELNPLDVAIAKERFTYLSKTPATTEIVVGDGRLSMEKELRAGKKQNFNIFIVDAFNDDAIPVHLLSKEAFAVYKAHLATDSIIAVHISNSYLDLTPVVTKAAAYHHMEVIAIDAPPTNDFQSRSKWVFLSANKKLLSTKELNEAKKLPLTNTNIRLWTDDYSNLFQIFRYN